MALVLKIVLIAASLYALAFLGSYALQRRLMYFPDPQRVSPSSVGVDAQERLIKTPDGETLVCWYAPAREGMPTLLYFHGNAGSLATRAERYSRYAARGFGIMMLSYRGYSGSTGSPSERRNVADAKLAYDALVESGVKPSDIILYGESLGSGIAVQVAISRPVAGVILDAPYTSIVDAAEYHYPRLPSRLFMTDRYETMNYISRLAAPLLIVHGSEDQIVPPRMGQAVFAAAPAPKEIAIIPGAGHSDHASFGSNEVIYRWTERLRAGLLTRKQAAE